MAGLQKEIWISELRENFYSNYDYLQRVEDMSQYVEFNTINLAAVGADPVVTKNNASYPIVAAQRTDTAIAITLDYYDTTTTRIYWNREEVEAEYDKLKSVMKQHKSKLIQDIVTECLWNYAPATAAAGNVAVTGANRAAVIGAQTTVAATMTINDLLGVKERWDGLDLPQNGRIGVLSVQHLRDLMAQDVSLFKSFADVKNGAPVSLYGIDLYVAANTPLFTKSTLAKKAFGAAADNTNDCVGSVFFIADQVMKAMGSIDMFYLEKERNPAQRADEVGFQMRFKGVPFRTTNFYQQSLVSNRA